MKAFILDAYSKGAKLRLADRPGAVDEVEEQLSARLREWHIAPFV